MLKHAVCWSLLKVMILSIGILTTVMGITPSVSHAIPSAGTYQLDPTLGGLIGTFTSNGTSLTAWSIKDPTNSFTWSNTAVNQSVSMNDAVNFQTQTIPPFPGVLPYRFSMYYDSAPNSTTIGWSVPFGTQSFGGTQSYSLLANVPEPNGLLLFGLALGVLALVNFVKQQRRQTGVQVG